MVLEYVFEDKDELVRYLYSILSNPTQIKVQKTLYLLYAFYGATYGQLGKHDKEDFNGQNYPKELFPANFQAWRYGPVEYDVYCSEKAGEYTEIEEEIIADDTPEEKNIKKFVDELVSQTDEIDDFSLVDRTHQDNVWLDNYQEGKRYIEMSNEDIVAEYKERYVKSDV